MLQVWIDKNPENLIWDIDAYFNNIYKDNWFDNEDVKRIVKDVDGSDVVSANLIQSPVLGPIGPDKLSGGTKVLICLMMDDNPEIMHDLSHCGNNCAKWIQYIADKKNITAELDYPMHFSDDLPVNIGILNTGKVAHSATEFSKLFLEV